MTQIQQQPDSLAAKAICPVDFQIILEYLDNFGLTPVQFRVYCHLLHKTDGCGTVSRSSESIAKVCSLTRITVLRVLVQLEKMQLIRCDRTVGKTSVFYLMPFSSWCMPAPEQKKQTDIEQSKVVQLRACDTSKPNSDTCKPNIQVNEIHTQQEVQEPFRGSCTLQAVQAVDKIDQLNCDTRLNFDSGKAATQTGGNFQGNGGSLDEKLAAARNRGWDAGTWWNDLGEQMVTVNRFVVCVTEFMQRSLDSFDVERHLCAEGLRMCRSLIEKIKQRKSQQRRRETAIALPKLTI